MSISRRGLFANISALAALPLAKLLPEAAKPKRLSFAEIARRELRKQAMLFPEPRQWSEAFKAAENLPVGSTLRIKLPEWYRAAREA